MLSLALGGTDALLGLVSAIGPQIRQWPEGTRSFSNGPEGTSL